MPKQSEIRKHYFEERYVIFAPKRAMRPNELAKKTESTSPPAAQDPFDPKGSAKEKSICEVRPGSQRCKFSKGKGRWDIKVIGNKFPALDEKNPKAYGHQEVVIETPEHGKHLNDLPIPHMVKVFDTFRERIDALSEDPKIKYVVVFKNEGGRAGSTINHAHSQIIGLPLIPPLIRHQADAVDSYQITRRSCPYDDIIKDEIKKKVRVFFNDGNFIGICPYAASSPYDVWLMPIKHKRNLRELTNTDKISLAKAYNVVADHLDKINMPYNFFLQRSLDFESHHMVIKIEPRPNIWGGLELGTGIVINPVFPEVAAKFYRKKIKKTH